VNAPGAEIHQRLYLFLAQPGGKTLGEASV
jgi:hypothetical protein